MTHELVDDAAGDAGVLKPGREGVAQVMRAMQVQVAKPQLATLMGQLVWDASQRWDHATAVGYCDQAISAANRMGETTTEAYAGLRKSYVALYGEQEPQAGLWLAQEAATLAGTAGSHALQGLALLHVGEGYAMLGDRRECEAALGAAEAHLQAMRTADPTHGLLSSTASDGYKAPATSPLATARRQGGSWRAPRAASTVVTSRRR